MRRLILTFAALTIALGSFAAPLSAGNREREQMMADIRMLQEQSQELQLMLGGLTDALKAITARIDEQAGATRKGFADQKLLIDGMSGDIRVLREKLDETNVRLISLSQDVEGVREMIPPPGAAPMTAPLQEGTETTTGTPAPSDGSPPTVESPPAPTVPGGGTGMTPRRLYEQAWADFAAGQWSLAIQGFETYLKTYPRSELADDAQYYIGESYAGDSRYREAAAAYERVIREYPNSDILPEAWYKVGISYDRLGQPDRAREAFEYVIKNYPDSDSGRLAKQNLDRLNRRVR